MTMIHLLDVFNHAAQSIIDIFIYCYQYTVIKLTSIIFVPEFIQTLLQ